MHETRPKIRLYFDAPLCTGAELLLEEQAHYVSTVMRHGPGDCVEVFNGRDGAWTARITQASKRKIACTVEKQIALQQNPPDVWLLFAPIKKARTDFIVEKAAEMGVSRICPVFTQFTNSERLRRDRLRAHAIEAAEQCGGTFVPEVAEAMKLGSLLSDWDSRRRILFCDERRNAEPAQTVLRNYTRGPWAILIGPEGGFSQEEADAMYARDFVVPVSLGPRVLRADTAAVAAIAAWQMALGDWV
ncbi:16S rRNA (uracil(1498)-N(3))-methyltransferase [Algicella marina]|uniref:Ribosomal RNA small subunit methyltransferase E n=1 Tax=Algicella marina TaxID=2683284 RepID=A0A6P1T2P3_9RHOB|nr:16S rRNA (uracil(1498)-N(3))-methyltransferase [Algicella marina]QHQ35933.1 16S rRNA (uracil(1498)-N(3))-methyltransferase [Algicella marina]